MLPRPRLESAPRSQRSNADMADFDVQGARKAGYSEAEIADYLGQQSKFDTAGARKSGYTDAEIIGHLSAAPQPAAPAQSADFTAGQKAAKSAGGVASSIAATINEAIPGLDEVAAGLAVPGRMMSGASLGQAWKGARDYQSGLMTGLREDHRNVSNFATGTGYALQAVPAMLSGGATAAPAATSAARASLATRAGRVGMTAARNATTGATVAAANALAGRGSVSDRAKAADAAIVPGAVAGVVVPATVEGVGYVAGKLGDAAGAVARTGVRAVNNMASKGEAGAFLDPHQEVLSRLSETLRKDGFTPEQITGALTEWNRVGGASPAFMDLIAQNGGGQNTMALIRGAALTGTGRNVASTYGARVAADLQDTAIDRTRLMSPGGRTIPQVEGEVEGRIAANSQAPQVEAGSGGVQVHQALNQRYDAAKAAVDDAYSAARAAAPEGAHLPASEHPQMAATLREAVADHHPQDVPSVTRILDGVDRLSTPTMRDLYEARRQLSSLRAGNDQQAVAAGQAVRALDASIQDAVERGVVAGDPQVVGLWRNAISLRRDMGRQFEGDDLIQSLTERGLHGAGRTNLVAPEDASGALIGRNAVSVRPDMVRDLTRVRDTLGEASPEWAALRQEAMSRILGRDAGTENFGRAWEGFSSQNPQLARLLMTPEEQSALLWNRASVANAVGDRAALQAGRGVLSTPSDQYAVTMTGVGHRLPTAQTGAAGEMIGMIERPPEGATGVLNRIGSATRATNNLAETYGEQPAADYQSSIRNMVDQVNNARFINPNTGAQTAGRLADETLVDSIPTSKASAVRWILDKFRSGHTMTDEERAILVQIATGKAEETAPRILPSMTGPKPRLPPRPPSSPVSVGAMTGDHQRRGSVTADIPGHPEWGVGVSTN